MAEPELQQQEGRPTSLPDGGIPEDLPGDALPADASPLGLTGELANDSRLDKFQSTEALAESYLHLESQSANSIRVPGPASTPEDRQAYLDKLVKLAPELMVKPGKDQMDDFYTTLGRPASADAYETPTIKDGEGEALDMSDAEAFKQIAHQVGLTQEQYTAVVENVTKANVDYGKEQLVAFGKSVEQLKGEWGNAYGERYKAAAQIALQTGAPEELLDSLKTGYVAPSMLKWLHGLSKQFGAEGGHIVNQEDGGKPDHGLAPAEAQAQLDEMMNNKEHPLWDSHHPDHAAAVQRRLALQIAVSPNASTSIDDLRA